MTFPWYSQFLSQKTYLKGKTSVSMRYLSFVLPAAALAIAWLCHQGEHVLPIPGTRHIEHLAELAAGGALDLTAEDLARIDAVLPIGWAHGDRYTSTQWIGPERYC